MRNCPLGKKKGDIQEEHTWEGKKLLAMTGNGEWKPGFQQGNFGPKLFLVTNGKNLLRNRVCGRQTQKGSHCPKSMQGGKKGIIVKLKKAYIKMEPSGGQQIEPGESLQKASRDMRIM